MFYSIDQDPEGIALNAISLQNSTLKFSIDTIHGSYEGKLGPEGNSINGTWTQGDPFTLDFQRATEETVWKIDPSPHTIQYISVDKDVKVEVLDSGGSGRPVALLAGLGNTAHIFDQFAPKLTPKYHVYGMTRREYGDSSKPYRNEVNYSSDRLADDVLAVDDALKLERPVLVSHSIAGEELSSIGSRHPEKVAGLVYLDAGYPYAFYDASRGNLQLDALDVQREIEQMFSFGGPDDQKPLVEQLLKQLPQFEKELQDQLKTSVRNFPSHGSRPPEMAYVMAVIAGEHKYTDIRVPCLAILAIPHDPRMFQQLDPAARAAEEANDLETTTAQANAFEKGIPTARVVRLPNAHHFVFRSNEANVLRKLNAFLDGLH
jgi:non-heme chloroperoxidase